MASFSTVSVAIPQISARLEKPRTNYNGGLALKPLKLRSSVRSKVGVCASMKEKAVTGLTAAAVTMAIVIPEIAEAAQPGISPSLKNFLLSIIAGGVVLGVLAGAVVGVSNFDPVKRS